MTRHWTGEEWQMLREATQFAHLAPIALRVIERMGPRIHEVCGPISTGGHGCPKKNIAFFGHAIDCLSQRNIPVFDVRPYQEAMNRIIQEQGITGYPMGILEEFYARVFETGCIVKGLFLPDWNTSTGARWERQKLMSLGVPVEDYPPEWLVGFKMPAELVA